MNREEDAVSNPSSNAEFGDILKTVARRRILQGGLGAATLAFLGNPREVLAQGGNYFFAIITNFGTAPRVNAQLEVSANTDASPAGADVLYTVFQNGNQVAEFTVQMNDKGLATNATAPAPNRNLFRITNGEPALVRARTPSGATTATAILNQRGQDTNLIIGIPLATKAAGTIFPVVVGTVGAAALLIGNVSGGEVVVDVFVGTTGARGTGKHSIQVRDNQFGRIDLDSEDQNAHLIVSASGNVVVQLMLDVGASGGRIHGVTCLPI